jgi:hypothetical protein
MPTIAVPPPPPPDEEDPLTKKFIKRSVKVKDILSEENKSSSDTEKSRTE